MSDINKVMLVGRLGVEPETKTLEGGRVMTKLNLATHESWQDKEGEKQERTQWHRVVLFGRQAELARDYLRKGEKVFVEGSLQKRSWTEEDGSKRSSVEVKGQRISFLGGGPRVEPGAKGETVKQEGMAF